MKATLPSCNSAIPASADSPPSRERWPLGKDRGQGKRGNSQGGCPVSLPNTALKRLLLTAGPRRFTAVSVGIGAEKSGRPLPRGPGALVVKTSDLRWEPSTL